MNDCCFTNEKKEVNYKKYPVSLFKNDSPTEILLVIQKKRTATWSAIVDTVWNLDGSPE